MVADEAFGRQVPFACLGRIAGDFKEACGDRARDAIAHSLDRAFGPKLIGRHMERLRNQPRRHSKVSRVQQQVSEVKEIMMDNIEKVLDRRGEDRAAGGQDREPAVSGGQLPPHGAGAAPPDTPSGKT